MKLQKRVHKLLKSVIYHCAKRAACSLKSLQCGREGWSDTYEYLLNLGYTREEADKEIKFMKDWYKKNNMGPIHWQKPSNETNMYFDSDSGVMIFSGDESRINARNKRTGRPKGRPREDNTPPNAELHKKYIEQWNEWLEENGFFKVRSGFNYHHPNIKTKKFEIYKWIRSHAKTPKNIEILKEELAKCIYLSKSEHSKRHGRPPKEFKEVKEVKPVGRPKKERVLSNAERQKRWRDKKYNEI